jgi:hypothetical protein
MFSQPVELKALTTRAAGRERAISSAPELS